MDRSALNAASSTWEAYMRAYGAMTRRFQSDGTFSELSMREYDILYALSKSACALTQSELMDAVVLSQPALSRMLGRLEAAGLICRSAHESDGRAHLMSLTDAGAALQKKIGRAHGQAVAQALYGALDQAELESLRSMCQKIIDVNPRAEASARAESSPRGESSALGETSARDEASARGETSVRRENE